MLTLCAAALCDEDRPAAAMAADNTVELVPFCLCASLSLLDSSERLDGPATDIAEKLVAASDEALLEPFTWIAMFPLSSGSPSPSTMEIGTWKSTGSEVCTAAPKLPTWKAVPDT